MRTFQKLSIVAFGCVVAFAATAALKSQDQTGNPPAANSKKNEAKSAKGKNLIAMRIKISAEGAAALPDQSSVMLKGLGGRCEEFERHGTLSATGEIALSQLPECKVMVKILVTGFETKILPSINLRDYNNSLLNVKITANGPPVVQ